MPSEEPTFLTTEQIAEKYPVPDMDSKHAWYRLLTRWRDRRLLKEGTDWSIQREAGKPPAYLYREVAVRNLLATSDAMFAISVRLEYRARNARIARDANNTQSQEVTGA